MPPSDDEQESEARAERARQLREEIEALKRGDRPHKEDGPKSIKEQIEERARENRERESREKEE